MDTESVFSSHPANSTSTAALTTLECGCPPRPSGVRGGFTHRRDCSVFVDARRVLEAGRAAVDAEHKARRRELLSVFVTTVTLRLPRPPEVLKPTLTCLRCGHQWKQRRRRPPRDCPRAVHDWRRTAEQVKRLRLRRMRKSMKAAWASKTPAERAAWRAKLGYRRPLTPKRDPLDVGADEYGKPPVLAAFNEARALVVNDPRRPAAAGLACRAGVCAHPACRRMREARP